jgi:uncharacterized SAM-binding protein YcdF (DUF218 family)
MNQKIDKLAQKIWHYHQMHHELEKADLILVLGSHDPRVAERGAELFLAGWAPLLVFSGGLGNWTKDVWDEPEADKFAKIAVKMGVPKEKILIENKSTNTGENIRFTKELLAQENLAPEKFIVVQKPYMERRAYATFKQVWPEKQVFVTSPQIPFNRYPTEEISKDDLINIMVGDLQRIRVYPQKGFQIFQDIPDYVWEAYVQLLEFGYRNHLIQD